MAAARLIDRHTHPQPQLPEAGGPARPLAEHPYFVSPRVNIAYPAAPARCGHCGSDDTLCRAFDYDEGQADKFGRYELSCPVCGWFTLYRFAD